MKKDIYILGISAFYHDSAAVLLKNDEIIAAVQEERFTRKKQDSSFPTNAVKYCLDYAQITLEQIDSIVFYEKPFLKLERLLETYYVFAPKGLISFLSAIPVWIKEKLFLRKIITDKLLEIDETLPKSRINLLFSNHHLSHSASAFYPSPFESSAILTVDGVGEWATATIAHGQGNSIKVLKELRFPHSLGLLYSAITYFLGFKVNSGEYKLMGLAPYGNKDSQQVEQYKTIIKDALVDIKSDGSIWLNQDYFEYATGLRMVNDSKWSNLFGFKKRNEEDELLQIHCDLALALQEITENVLIKMAQTAQTITGEKNLCLAGGVALNCVANGKLLQANIFDNIWIQPASGDAGGALGAAYEVYHSYYKKNRIVQKQDKMKGSYLGPEFTDDEILKVIKKAGADYEYIENFDELVSKTANVLSKGNVVGWFQGRMEWGPRALGNRSIIGDARNKDLQKKLNLKIKFRESFRPFAPSVLIERVNEYFETNVASPYMLLVADVKKERRVDLPHDYSNYSIRDKLYFNRSDLPSITHTNYSARLQTVHKDTNYKYWSLIKKFEELTGYAVIINTSFNVRGEPIVCTPKEAYACFVKTDMDYLVIGNYFFDKKKQKTNYIKYTLEDRVELD